MNPYQERTPPFRRAVYLSAPVGDYTWIYKIARLLNEHGASVFIDEVGGSLDEHQREGGTTSRLAYRIPPAIWHADELVVVLPRPFDSSSISNNDIFPRRDFAVIALALARVRDIPSTVFLPSPLDASFVLGSKQAPPFLTDGELKVEVAWEEYYRQLKRKPKPTSGEPKAFQLARGLDVCLCWISDGRPVAAAREDGKVLQDKLKTYGLDSELVIWTNKRGILTPDEATDVEKPFDALAVCAADNEWVTAQAADLFALTTLIHDQRCPVVYVHRGEANTPIPERCRGWLSFRCPDDPTESQLLGLVRGLIGFKDWRAPSRETPTATQSAPTATSPSRGSSAPANLVPPSVAVTRPGGARPKGLRSSTKADIAIVTILPEEYAAVLSRLRAMGCATTSYPGSKQKPNQYGWVTTDLSDVTQRKYRIVVAGAVRPGQTRMSNVIHMTWAQFRPRYVILAGIAGGFPQDGQGKGDVAISEVIYDYEYGKVGGKFQPRPNFTYQVDEALLTSAVNLHARDKSWAEWSRSERPDGMDVLPQLRYGPIASGNKVVDDATNVSFAPVLKVWPKLLAIEMEGAGAVSAIESTKASKKVGFLMVRGISDLPNTEPRSRRTAPGTQNAEDRERWKRYAAAVAADFTIHWIMQSWPLPPQGPQ